MTQQEIKAAIESVLGPSRAVYPRHGYGIIFFPNTVEVRCTRTVTVTYGELRALSKALGTTDIDLNFSPESPGYSEYTPGDSAEFTIEIGIGASS